MNDVSQLTESVNTHHANAHTKSPVISQVLQNSVAKEKLCGPAPNYVACGKMWASKIIS